MTCFFYRSWTTGEKEISGFGYKYVLVRRIIFTDIKQNTEFHWPYLLILKVTLKIKQLHISTM